MQKKKLENYEKKILSNKKEMIETYLNKLNCLCFFFRQTKHCVGFVSDFVMILLLQHWMRFTEN